MDPKQQLNQLDPKLQETYDRVMGTNVPQTPTQQSTPPVPTPAQTQPQMEPPLEIPPAPQIPIPEASPVAPQPMTSAPTTVAVSGFVAGNQHAETKNKHKISPVLVVFGVIVFFAAYAIFWVKFFNVSLPFLPI